METFSLQKSKNIIKFWDEITLSPEQREKRMREKADKAAQEFHEKLFGGKIQKEEIRINEDGTREAMPKGRKADTKALDRFLALGLNEDMFKPPKPTTTQPKEEEKTND